MGTEFMRPGDGAVVVTAVASRRDRRDFVSLPYALLEGDPHWTPPLRLEASRRLDPKKNPFFRHAEVRLLLARRHGKAVGRAAVFVDRNYDRLHGSGDLLFGMFDCADSGQAFSALASAMGEEALRRGRGRLVGPLTFSVNQEAGLLLEGFDAPNRVLTPYNPAWYPARLQEQGFTKFQDLLAYSWNAEMAIPERLRRVSRRVLSRPGAKMAHISTDRFEEEVRALHDVYNDAFAGTWGHVPMTSAEFRDMAQGFRKVGDPRLTFLVRVNGEAAAFGLTVPDWNQALRGTGGRLFPTGLFRILAASRRIDAARFIVLAVRRRFQGHGLEAPIILGTMEAFRDLGYRDGELSMVMESNLPMRRVLERVVGSPIRKRYRIYQRPVGREVAR